MDPLVKLIREHLPHASIVISTGTETGQDKARQLIPEADGFFFLPLDFPEFIHPVIKRIRPDIFVLMETELWPNLIHALHRRGTKIVLANGRISDRSFPRYVKLKRLFAPTLALPSQFLMSSQADAKRIITMGAEAAKVRVTGNTKYDAPALGVHPDVEAQVRRDLGIPETAQVFVTGSVHPGEFQPVLEAYAGLTPRFPELILILVPRHIERTPEILAVMDRMGLPQPYLRSAAHQGRKRNGRRVIVLDVMGELFRTYSVADVVFIGGSLVSKGGQNIIEPAAWGKVTLFGPHMEDFRVARRLLLDANAAFEVNSAAEMAHHVERCITDPAWSAATGQRGKAAVSAQVGSAERNAASILSLLRE